MFFLSINWSVFENFDRAVFEFAERIKCVFLDYLLGIASWLGDFAIPWFVLAIVLMCFKKTRKIGFLVALSVGISSLLNEVILKHIFQRIRPYEYEWTNGFIFNDELYRPSFLKIPGTLSFPSGHTGACVAPTFVLWYYKKYKLAIPALIVALLTGFSRIYVHDHYPTDVLFAVITGIIAGIICVWVGHLIFDKLVPHIKRKKEGKNT